MTDPSTHNLAGTPIAEAIQQRLREQVSALDVQPKLAIIHISPDPSADTYVKQKQRFGQDIGVIVDIHTPRSTEIEALITDVNDDDSVHGIIIQLPLPDHLPTDELLDMVAPSKDVDGLNSTSAFTTAGTRGLMELLAAYQIKLQDVAVHIIGEGRLLGAPLKQSLEEARAKVTAYDKEHPVPSGTVFADGIIIGATGSRTISSEMIGAGAIVIDATSVDVAPELSRRDDIRLTPPTGGVGPMTVAALFENLIEAI